MLIYRCPMGHLYGVGGYGEDLTQRIERLGRMHDCPACKSIHGEKGPAFPGGSDD